MLYRLNEAGFDAHLVGGGVRDLLLGEHPKDFDVATNASPEEVRQTFRNCRLIGRRFRLAHVHFGREVIEVATFRAPHDKHQSTNDNTADQNTAHVEDGMILRDNVFGSVEEDALRRDLTINALYYNVRDFSITDYANGMADLDAGLIRLIGDPDTRYREDPVRMLRAVRFAAKLGFDIEPATEAPLYQHGDWLDDIPPARLFEEVNKLFLSGYGHACYILLRKYGLFEYLFRQTDDVLSGPTGELADRMIQIGLHNSDQRIAEGKPVTPAYLFATLLWEPVRLDTESVLDGSEKDPSELRTVGYEVLDAQREQVTIPKRFQIMIRDIWNMQPRFLRQQTGRANRLAQHPKFRAAYDFLCLRSHSGEISDELCQWWTEFQNAQTHTPPSSSTSQSRPKSRPSSQRRRNRNRKPVNKDETASDTTPPANDSTPASE